MFILLSARSRCFGCSAILIPFIQKEVITAEDTLNFFHIITESFAEDAEEMLHKQKYLMFNYKHTTNNDAEVSLRVTAYFEMGNIAIAMRLVLEAEKTLEELNLPAMLKEVMHEPSGLFLIVGATGKRKINRTRGNDYALQQRVAQTYFNH